MSQTAEQREEIMEYNRRILQEHQTSTIELPPLFAMYRYDVPDQRVPSIESHWMATLLTAERCPNTRTQWRFQLVRNPVETIDAASVYQEHNDRWLNGETHSIFVQKLSSDGTQHGRLVHTKVKFDNIVISITGANQQIPCLDVSDAVRILPRRFIDLEADRRGTYRFFLRPREPIIQGWNNVMGGVELRDAHALLQRIEERFGITAAPHVTPQPTAPAPATQQRIQVRSVQPTMPQHVVNAFINSEIAAGRVCPISQEPLTRDTACLTPCGHVYSFDEVARWIQGAHSCPDCRAAVEVGQLQRWRS